MIAASLYWCRTSVTGSARVNQAMLRCINVTLDIAVSQLAWEEQAVINFRLTNGDH